MCQRRGDLRPVTHRQLRTQAARGNKRIERLAFYELHHDEMAPVGLTYFVDGADMGIVQGGGGSCFTKDLFSGSCCVARIRLKDFEGDIAFQVLIVSSIDLAHSAGPEPFYDSIMRD